jgi:hypothetical protein
VIKDVKPDTIINLGDCADCYAISAYDKDPARVHGLQDEIDMVRAHLHQVAQLAPEAQRYYLEGNHEDRLRRLIWTLPGTASELARLRSFQQAMTWPSLLGLPILAGRLSRVWGKRGFRSSPGSSPSMALL